MRDKQGETAAPELSFALLDRDLLEPKSGSLESLAAASAETLEALMMTRMNTAANLRKDIALLIGELAEQIADAKVAELILRQNRNRKRNVKPKGGSCE
jgi:hypothetical protein